MAEGGNRMVCRKKALVALFMAAAVGISSIPATAASSRMSEQTVFLGETQERSKEFDEDWLFMLEAEGNPWEKSYDDSVWRKLDLPHDWSIEQDINSSNSTTIGALKGGTGWYRKHFVIPKENKGKRICIDFDGVYCDSYVYVNGKLVGSYPNGYIPFSFDITDAVVCDGVTENVIAVKVQNPTNQNGEGITSRWYSGSGIYRDVYLTATDPVHIEQWGTNIRTPGLAEEYNSGDVRVETSVTVENETSEQVSVQIRNTILNYEDKSAFAGAEAVISEEQKIGAGESADIYQELTAHSPQLWSVESPNLYLMKTEVLIDGEAIDTYETRFGFKWFEFDADDGFSLNGKWMKLKGACMHHDQGALGAVANVAAMKRQMRIMKEMGVNTIRTSHNAAAPELVRICDEMGLMLFEESFDSWEGGKNQQDYGKLFFGKQCTYPGVEAGVTWAEFDMKQIVKKDRNCPSLIIWGVGNEVMDTNTAAGIKFAEQIAGWVKEIDADHPVAMGENKYKLSYGNAENMSAVINKLDLAGLNYGEAKYDELHEKNPEWKIFGSETASAIKSRGYYSDPWINGNHIEDNVSGNQAQDVIAGKQLSSYDNNSVRWGRSATEAWIFDRDRKYISGQFIWTGFDYIGEPTPFYGSSHSSYFGVVDTAGFPKDEYYLYQSQWTDVEESPMVHIYPHWNWENDQLRSKVEYPEKSALSYLADGEKVDYSDLDVGKIPVRVYSNAASVELFLDGISQGKKTFAKKTTDYGYEYQQQSEDSDRLYLEWPLAWSYKAGTTIETIAYDDDGKEVARDKVVTAGEAARLNVSPEKKVIEADGKDLCYITVDVQDEQGNFVPGAENEISFKIKGEGRIVGVDNGNPASKERYQDTDGVWKRKAFSGKVLVIVQSTKKGGSFTLTASGTRLQQDSVTIYTKPTGADNDTVLGYETPKVFTNIGVLPVLPETVETVRADGETENVSVDWENVAPDLVSRIRELRVRGTLENGMEVEAVVEVKGPAGVWPVSVITGIGQSPRLPETVDIVWTDGTEEERQVEWDSILDDDLATTGKFIVYGRVSGYPDFSAEAHIAVCDVAETVISSAANGGKASVTANNQYAGRLIDGVWADVDGWNNKVNATENNKLSEQMLLTFREKYEISKVSIYVWNSAYAMPDINKTVIEYQTENGEWKQVTGLVVPAQWTMWSYRDFTFDTIRTDQMRFTFGLEAFPSGKNSFGVAEISVYSRILPSGSSTAQLSDLQVNGQTVEGFDAGKNDYSLSLNYKDSIPVVTAEAAEDATCFVRQAVTGDREAIVEVTSQDGKTQNVYTIHFEREDAKLEQTVLQLPEIVTEDDIVNLDVIGVMEDGTQISEGAEVKWSLVNDTGYAKIQNGKLYAYDAGTVTLTAEMTYKGKSVVSAPSVCTIRKNEVQKEAVSCDEVRVKTKVGREPELPDTVTVNYSNGLPREKQVYWKGIPERDYGKTNQFTVEGVVEGIQIRALAVVEAVDALAAENISLAVPENYPVELPETVTAYFSDNTTEKVRVEWEAEPFRQKGTLAVYRGEADCGKKKLKVQASVRTAESIQSLNYVATENGYALPAGLASFTNDQDAPNKGNDSAAYLNEGKAFFENEGKAIWCNYVNPGDSGSQREEDWVTAVIAYSGEITERLVDTLEFGLMDEQGNSGTRIPQDYWVEYYSGPEYTLEMEGMNVVKAGHVEEWEDSPLNDTNNWKEVTYVGGKPGLPERKDYAQMNTVKFLPVKTTLVRLRMKAFKNFCLGVNEIRVFGSEAAANAEIKDVQIRVDGEDYTGEFQNGELRIPVNGEEFPGISAYAGENAAVTVIPATAVNPTGTVRIMPESGNTANAREYRIVFEQQEYQESLKKAQEIDREILAIGEVTLGKKETINRVREEYEAMTELEKSLVRQLAVLELSEYKWKVLDISRQMELAKQEANSQTAQSKEALARAKALEKELKEAKDAWAKAQKPKAEEPGQAIQKGQVYNKGDYYYRVTSLSGQTVEITGVKNESLTKITVCGSVVLGGKIYKVTAVAPSAFKNNKKVTSAVIENNVEIIGDSAFYGCKKLKKVTAKSGQLARIGNKAFAGCKNLKTIIFKGKVLKKAGKNAFKGIHKKAVIKVPAAKRKTYVKLLAKKGQNRTVRIK